MPPSFETTVFCDAQGEAAARVYVLAAPTVERSRDELAGFELRGKIIGPTCKYTSTLQAAIPLRHRGLTQWGGRTALVAEAVVPDPCYWSTELPFLYRFAGQVQAVAAEGESTELQQTFGMRSLGTIGRRLTFNGTAWVPRIVHRVELPADTPLEAWRDAATVMYVEHADDDVCRRTSETGVWVVTSVAGNGPTVIRELARLGRFPSVAAIVVKSHEAVDRDCRTAAQNTLLLRFSDRKFTPDAADNFDALLAMSLADQTEWGLEWAAGAKMPVVVLRPLDRVVPLAEARAACDALQRDLAGKHDVAGFMV